MWNRRFYKLFNGDMCREINPDKIVNQNGTKKFGIYSGFLAHNDLPHC